MPEITDVLSRRAGALVEEIAMAEREGWSAKRISELQATRAEALDELHGHAYADHVRMYVRLLPDQTLRSMAAFAELVDQTSPRTAIATQVVRDLLHERNYLVDGAWRCNCHAGNAVPGADFPRCGAGVSQWR